MMPAVPARVDPATPTEPDRGVPGTTRTRLRAAAVGVVGALLMPLPAAAAPAPCGQAQRYAAQSGTELIRIGGLTLGPAQPITNVGVGDIKSALVAQPAIKSAAVGRVIDGGQVDRKALAEVLQQTAPPTNGEPRRQRLEPTEAGPFRLGPSDLSVHARWNPAMACGKAAGEVTRAEVVLRRAEVGDDALVRVPGRLAGLSTTAMQRPGGTARTAAEASMTRSRIDLLGGAITIRIVKPPSLLATMSSADGGEVRYRPAVLEVSGEGFEPARLEAAGDRVELRFDEEGRPVTDDDGAAATPERRAGDGDPGRPGDDGDSAGSGSGDNGQVGSGQAGSGQVGSKASRAGQDGVGVSRAGASRAGASRTGASQTGVGQTGVGQTGVGQTGGGQAGAGRARAAQVGAGQAGSDQAGEAAPAQAGASQAGADQAGAGESGADQAGASQAGADQAGAGVGRAGEGRAGGGQDGAGSGSRRGVGGDRGGEVVAGVTGAGGDLGRRVGAEGGRGADRGRGGSLRGAGAGRGGVPLPVPPLPGVPPLTERPVETVPVAGTGTTVRISVGDVRQAASGHAIAAKATAVTVVVNRSSDARAYGEDRGGVALNLGLGLLEVVAVAPEPAAAASGAAVGGRAGGLPVTGPRVDVLALSGVALLIAGGAALIFGMRRRSRS